MAIPNGEPTLQVVACGLPRTGTTTTGRALSILLNGPVLDGIADTFLDGTLEQQNDMQRLPTLDSKDPQLKVLLQKILTANKPYVATTDSPFPHYLQELQELYPQLKFVCMVRPFDAWYASFARLQASYGMLAPYTWLWPRLRRCVDCIESHWALRWGKQLGGTAGGKKLISSELFDEHTARSVWDAHMDYVKRVVPPEKVLFFDVRDGWDPLCEFLRCEKPVTRVKGSKEGEWVDVDVQFPHAFSGASLNEWRDHLLKGFKLQIVAMALGGGLAITGCVMLAKRLLDTS